MCWDGMPLKNGCDKNTITINECAHAVWKAVDDELNALFQEQLSYLRDSEAKYPEAPPYPPSRGASEELINAQQAWVIFRDKDCQYRLGHSAHFEHLVGSGDHFERLKCMYKHTLKRSDDLREYLACRVDECPR